jgi:hypothetical protein
MARKLQKRRPVRRAPRKPTMFFVVDRETNLETLAEIGRQIPRIRGLRIQPSQALRPLTAQQIDHSVDRAMRQLPRILSAIGHKQRLTEAERETIRRGTADFLDGWYRSPKIDFDLIRANAEMLGFRGSPGTVPMVLGNRLQLILADTQGPLLLRDGTREVTNEEVPRGALIVDLIFEVVGLILGLIGLSPPQGARKGLLEWLASVSKNDTFKKALEKLLKDIAEGKWTGILNFLDALEQSGNLHELLLVFAAHLGWIDAVLTIIKIIAWIVAALVPGGQVAFIAKLVGLAADLLGISHKAYELAHLA